MEMSQVEVFLTAAGWCQNTVTRKWEVWQWLCVCSQQQQQQKNHPHRPFVALTWPARRTSKLQVNHWNLYYVKNPDVI